MRQYKVVHDVWSHLQPLESVAGSEGLSVGTVVSDQDGSSHVELSVAELAPGGVIRGHLHPFEESFFIVEGQVQLSIDGSEHALQAEDFGFVPVSAPHAWHNTSDRPVRWYRVRSPQPRPLGRATGTFPIEDLPLPRHGRPVVELEPRSRYVGRYDENDLPAPGPLTMPGAHGHNIRDVSIRMMVDDVLGSIHHQVFMVQFQPSDEEGFSGSAHFHDFEEAYLVMAGQGEVQLEDERFLTGPGDLVWASSGTMHAWTARGSEPLRFIELMAPRPPYTNMLFSERTWRDLSEELIDDEEA